MGRWGEAETHLRRLKAAGNSALFHEASVDFYQRRGELEKSLQHAEAWVQESPLNIQARRELLHLIAKRDGTRAAWRRSDDPILPVREEQPPNTERDDSAQRQKRIRDSVGATFFDGVLVLHGHLVLLAGKSRVGILDRYY